MDTSGAWNFFTNGENLEVFTKSVGNASLIFHNLFHYICENTFFFLYRTKKKGNITVKYVGNLNTSLFCFCFFPLQIKWITLWNNVFKLLFDH